jgi:GTP pyrophosphokinase
MIEREIITADAERLSTLINEYLETHDRLQVMKAFEFARREHGAQRRKTGEPFYYHPLTVATYLAAYRLDAAAISAALLHDIAEDTRISLDEIEAEFGPEVAGLVDGVTKLKEVTRGVAQGQRLSTEELQQATLQKLLGAMTVDVRTVIIKLFDRLHNMRTIQGMSQTKQRAKAQETLDVFAPLANRLGMWELKSELEGRSLEVLHPHAHATIHAELMRLFKEHEPLFETVQAEIIDRLGAAGLSVQEVKPSPENVYTVFKDLDKQGLSYRHVDRMLRITVLMEDNIDCYTALGHLHEMWRAVPYRIDDYISVQRENLYQSLHTTVVHTSGQTIKIRVRTVDMDKVAQIGVLAKWYYAGTPLWSPGLARRLDEFFANIKDSISVEPQDTEQAVRSAVEDVLSEQIHVYTPKGDSIDLVQGGTAIDFAYRIHTDLGNRLIAAYVNDLLFPLNKPLKNGDRVRIEKSPRAQPKRAWLDEDLGYIKTTYARMHARRWFRRLPEGEAIRQGRNILNHELEMLGLFHLSHDAIAALFTEQGATELYYKIGRAELLPTDLSTRIMTDRWTDARCLPIDNVVTAADGSTYVITNANNRRLHLCGTCEPRPGDSIVGFLRQDGVTTVHRENCRTLNAANSVEIEHRLLKLGWGETETRQARLITLNVDVYDRPGLLHEITLFMREKDINIFHICTFRKKEAGELMIEMELEVMTPRQMVRVLHQIQALVNVKSVRCVPEGPGRDNGLDRLLPGFYQPE